MWMMKKQTVVALVLMLAIPVVLRAGGLLFSLTNPEIAAGHPNYVRNYHLLSLVKHLSMWTSFLAVAILWVLVCSRDWGPSGSRFWRCCATERPWKRTCMKGLWVT
jgi:hypothetical protein